MTNGEESENADWRIRRILTKSRLVNDIDSALDLQNYDRFDIQETQKKSLELQTTKTVPKKFILPTIHRMS